MSACSSRSDCASGFVCVASARTCAGDQGLCVPEEPCNVSTQCGFAACQAAGGEICHCYTCPARLSCVDDGKCFACSSFSQPP